MGRYGKRHWWAAGVALVGVAGLVTAVSLMLVDAGGGDSKPGGEDSVEVGKKWDQQAVDVNASGVVIGYDMAGGNEGPVWMWKDGDRTELDVPDFGEHEGVEVVSINDDGDIIGNITFDDGLDEREVRPLKWHVDTPGKYTALSFGGEDVDGGAKTLRQDGTVLGSTDAGEYEEPERLWQWDGDEAGEEMPQPDAVAKDPGFDWAVAGDWVTTIDYRWNLDAPKDGESTRIEAAAADTEGVVYGTRDDRPAFEDDKDVTELPVLSDKPDHSTMVTEVSQDGEVIAGQALSEDGAIYPVVWRCAD